MTRSEALEVVKERLDYYEREKRLKAACEILIPELTESEDERIRNRIISYLKQDIEEYPEREERINKMIAWLEKQKEQNTLSTEETELNSLAFLEQMGYTCIPPEKEQKPVEDWREERKKECPFRKDNGCERYVDVVCECTGACSWVVDYPKLKEIQDKKEQKSAEWDELQGEFRNINEAFEDGKKEVVDHPEKYGLCKSIEWSEEDEEMICALNICIDELVENNGWNYVYTKSRDIPIVELKKWFKSLRPQPKAEWSEEDKKMLHSIIEVLEVMPSARFIPIKRETMIPWLESLHERFNLQPKQEWSEEDENYLKEIIDDLKFCIKNRRSCRNGLIENCIDWLNNRLKSVRPQPKRKFTFWDKQIIDDIIKVLEQDNKFVEQKGLPVRIYLHQNEIFWLQNLKEYLYPRPSWKPSEEQMEALKEIINTLAASKHPHENDYLFNVLGGLRKSLKKL